MAAAGSCENYFNLNDESVIRNFDSRAPLSEAFRFVRLRQTGLNHIADAIRQKQFPLDFRTRCRQEASHEHGKNAKRQRFSLSLLQM